MSSRPRTEALDESAARSGTRRAALVTCSWPGSSRGRGFAVEEPRQAHRPTTAQARVHQAAQRPDLHRVPAQGAAAPDLSFARPQGAGAARRVAEVGQALPLEPFVKLAARITAQRYKIEGALIHGLSNARVEQIDTQIRLIMRRGFGFRSTGAVISLAMLSLGGLRPLRPHQANELA